MGVGAGLGVVDVEGSVVVVVLSVVVEEVLVVDCVVVVVVVVVIGTVVVLGIFLVTSLAVVDGSIVEVFGSTVVLCFFSGTSSPTDLENQNINFSNSLYWRKYLMLKKRLNGITKLYIRPAISFRLS